MESVTLSLELISLLFFVAATAGLIDTLAGGGGLLTVPALILCGLPPLTALGTNKMQSCIGTTTASLMMFRKRRVKWKDVRFLMLAAFIGSSIGTVTVQSINTDDLSFIIPIVLLFIAVYFIISPIPVEKPTEAKISHSRYKAFVAPVIGFYDGMFGPGTGSFFALSGVVCRGHDLIHSTAIAKTLNFSTNIAAFIVFLISGRLVWQIGIVMMLGQVLGAWLGAHCLFKINPAYLRGIIVLMCSGMLIRYGYSLGWFSLV